MSVVVFSSSVFRDRICQRFYFAKFLKFSYVEEVILNNNDKIFFVYVVYYVVTANEPERFTLRPDYSNILIIATSVKV